VKKELSHGGHDRAFVGLAARSASIDIGLDVRIARGGGLSGHVETAPHLGASAFDAAFAFELSGVAVLGRYACENDGLVASRGGDFAKLAEYGPCGDFPNADDALHAPGALAHGAFALDELSGSCRRWLRSLFR